MFRRKAGGKTISVTALTPMFLLCVDTAFNMRMCKNDRASTTPKSSPLSSPGQNVLYGPPLRLR